MTDVKELEKLEKIQEKIVKKKKAHTEKAKEKGDLKSIEKAQTEENEAIAVLEKIREDKRRAEAGSEKQENSSQAQSEKVMMEGEKILKTLKPSRWAYFWWYLPGVIWLILVVPLMLLMLVSIILRGGGFSRRITSDYVRFIRYSHFNYSDHRTG